MTFKSFFKNDRDFETPLRQRLEIRRPESILPFLEDRNPLIIIGRGEEFRLRELTRRRGRRTGVATRPRAPHAPRAPSLRRQRFVRKTRVFPVSRSRFTLDSAHSRFSSVDSAHF